jgi:hypothetical protein
VRVGCARFTNDAREAREAAIADDTSRAGSSAEVAALLASGRDPVKGFNDANDSRRLAPLAFGAMCVAFVLVAAPRAWSGSSRAEAKSPPILTVHAQIRPYGGNPNVRSEGVPYAKIFFNPTVLSVGRVKIVARNYTNVWLTVAVNGVQSRSLGPQGGTAVLRVTFKKPGKYLAAVLGDEGPAAVPAILTVLR